MATRQLGEELLPWLTPMIDIIDTAEDVQQQQILELLVARHAERMMNPRDAEFVVKSMVKHIRQLQVQFRQLRDSGRSF